MRERHHPIAAPTPDRYLPRMVERITAREFQAAPGVEDWRVVGDGACAFFRTGSFTASAGFVAAVSELPGINDQPPDLDIRAGGVTVRLITYTADYFGMSRHDVELARQISAASQPLNHGALEPAGWCVGDLGTIAAGFQLRMAGSRRRQSQA